MTRETKVGIVIIGSFVCLAGAVVALKWQDAAQTPDARPETVAESSGGKPRTPSRPSDDDARAPRAGRSDPKATSPIEVKPPDPVQVKPTDPIQVKPTDPVEVKPTDPVQVKPVDPVQVKPTDPVQVKPTDPIEVKPTDPVQVKPTDPTTARPAEASTVKPTVASTLPDSAPSPTDGMREGTPLPPLREGGTSEHPASDHGKPADSTRAATTDDGASKWMPSDKPVSVPGIDPAADPSRVRPTPADPGTSSATAKVIGMSVSSGSPPARTDSGPTPIATGQPESEYNRLVPRPQPRTDPAAPEVITPTVSVSSTPLPTDPPVEKYQEDEIICQAGDTFRSLSLSKYQKEDYAEALRLWNIRHKATGLQPDGITLVPGGKLYVPQPPSTLERYFPEAVKKVGTGAAPPAAGGSVTPTGFSAGPPRDPIR